MGDYGHNGTCRDCGGSNGSHYNDCTYDGSSGWSHRSSLPDGVKSILLPASVIFMGLCPPIGVVLFFILIHG